MEIKGPYTFGTCKLYLVHYSLNSFIFKVNSELFQYEVMSQYWGYKETESEMEKTYI